MTGPLEGLKVVEFAGIGPGPHAAMVLADLGADVTRLARIESADQTAATGRGLLRGGHTSFVNLKDAGERQQVLDLIAMADVLLEGFRPGVMERLGLGPARCQAVNTGLIYARVTGWGQTGPLAGAAGHDINYIAVTGILNAMGPQDAPPVPPLNLVGNFGGGSMLTLVGIMSALWQRERTGKGQVIDAAMVDGANLLADMFWSWQYAGLWHDRRGPNLLNGAAPFYRTYACSDGKYIAVGALEDQFYHELLLGLGLADLDLPDRWDHELWPQLAAIFETQFAGRTRDDWSSHFANSDACVTPVLTFAEAPTYPQLRQRESFIDIDGEIQPAPAPRFADSPASHRNKGTETELAAVLVKWRGQP